MINVNAFIILFLKRIGRNEGSVAVEFALVFTPFIISIFFILELCRMSFVISAMDLALSESGYTASVTRAPDKYLEIFTQKLDAKLANVPLIGAGYQLHTSVTFCDNISQLISTQQVCSTQISNGKQLAIYELELDYHPMFLTFATSMFEKYLTRNLIFVQEFQRDIEQ